MVSLFCTSQSFETVHWHPLMLQQEHPEPLVRSLVLPEIEMAYLRTERKGSGHFCMFCGVMEKAMWWKCASVLQGRKQTGFSTVSFVCSFPLWSSVWHTCGRSYSSARREVLRITYLFRPQEFGAQLLTLLTSFVCAMAISDILIGIQVHICKTRLWISKPF